MEYQRQYLLNKLDEWYTSNSNIGLLVSGLPRVGKTYLIKKWLSLKNYKFTYIDEDDYINIKDIFTESNLNYDVKIINALSYTKPLGEILIFDGICPNDLILSSIKKICLEKKHRYIFISNYGEYLFKKMRFIPVGYLQIINIKPLSFKEFIENHTSPLLLKSIKFDSKKEAFEITNGEFLSDLWNIYSNFGGFPSVLNSYFNKGIIFAIKELENIKNEIIYLINSIKYNKQVLKLLNSYSNQRSSVYKSFVLNKINKGATFKRYENSINILIDLGLINILNFKDLENNNLKSQFDLFLVDPGLERAFSNINNNLLNRYHSISGVFFNFLLDNNMNPYRLCNKNGIIDFAINNPPITFEVKISYAGFKTSTKRRYLYGKKEKDFLNYVLLDKGKHYMHNNENLIVCPVWYYLITYE